MCATSPPILNLMLGGNFWGQFLGAPKVSFCVQRGTFKKHFKSRDGIGGAYYVRAEADDIGVIILPRMFCDEGILAHGRTDVCVAICRHAHANARATNKNAHCGGV